MLAPGPFNENFWNKRICSNDSTMQFAVYLLFCSFTAPVKKIIDQSFGLLWIMAYAGSILPFFYFKSASLIPG